MNTPTLETERLILRKFTENDMEAFFLIYSDEQVNQFLPWFPLKSVEETQRFFAERYAAKYKQPQAYAYAICLKKGNTELTEKMNAAIKELKEDGTIDSIMDNYIGEDAGKTPYESPEDVDRSNGTLVMATNAEFEPYEYHEGDDIVGIDADIAQAICDKLGYELKIEDMEFDSILPAVQSGKADFGAAGMTVTEDRKSSVDFTDTYADASQVIIVKK